MRWRPIIVTACTLAAAGLAGGSSAPAQTPAGGHAQPGGTAPHEQPKGPVRMTMDELHKHGGIPPGWRFALPAGDRTAGRELFVALECYKCHGVAGERFPAHARDVGNVGPDLSGMGAQHPPEYLAESLVHPNAVIVMGEGHTGPDGLSRMPEYNDTLTVTQLIDLVAYLQSLTGGHRHRSMPSGGGSPDRHGPPAPPKGQRP